MTFINSTKLAGSVLAVLACASFLSCSRATDHQDAMQTSATTETASNTTIAAADDTPETLNTTGTVPPGSADAASAAPSDEKTTTTTKKTKHTKKTKKAKKSASILAPAAPVATNEDDSYYYDSELATTDSGMLDPSQDVGAVDASQDFDDTVSATTMAPDTFRENGLSPFFHEPDSRFPIQIGSGQMTGEDKSTTILEGPSLFQDPAALGRDLTR